MANKYKPPVQGSVGQIVDSLFILLLVYIALMAPLFISFGSDETTATDVAEVVAVTPSWEELGQNETMQAQWGKLGVSREDAAAIINDKFDYGIEPVALGVTALTLIGYWLFMLTVSKRQYREVINEKFGNR